jgi:LCP family protein required for cell wall assembly
MMHLTPEFRRILLRSSIVVVVAVALVVGSFAFRTWWAWAHRDKQDFDVQGAREEMASQTAPTSIPDASATTLSATTTSEEAGPVFGDDAVDAYLIIGNDQREKYGPSSRADVVMLFLLPVGEADPVLVSIPRDLWLDNPCTGGRSRISDNLNGCGDSVSGPEQLAVAVSDYTGIEVDHFVMFGFDGFKSIINRVGGVEVCVGDHPVRDTSPHFELPAGCSVVDGKTALAWMRSRHTQEYVDGAWRMIPGMDARARLLRHEELILEAFRRVKELNSLAELTGLVEDLADAFAVDETLSLGEAIDLAWQMRSIDPSSVLRPVIPTTFYTTESGAIVLIETSTFQEVLESVWPEAGEILWGA